MLIHERMRSRRPRARSPSTPRCGMDSAKRSSVQTVSRPRSRPVDPGSRERERSRSLRRLVVMDEASRKRGASESGSRSSALLRRRAGRVRHGRCHGLMSRIAVLRPRAEPRAPGQDAGVRRQREELADVAAGDVRDALISFSSQRWARVVDAGEQLAVGGPLRIAFTTSRPPGASASSAFSTGFHAGVVSMIASSCTGGGCRCVVGPDRAGVVRAKGAPPDCGRRRRSP